MYVCMYMYVYTVCDYISTYLVGFCLRHKVCKNGGTCYEEKNVIKCKCVIGFTGMNCEMKGEIYFAHQPFY